MKMRTDFKSCSTSSLRASLAQDGRRPPERANRRIVPRSPGLVQGTWSTLGRRRGGCSLFLLGPVEDHPVRLAHAPVRDEAEPGLLRDALGLVRVDALLQPQDLRADL